MGYRSDVWFACPKADALELHKKFEDLKLYNLLDNADNCDPGNWHEIEFLDNTWVIFNWEGIKWYVDYYTDVEVIDDYMREDTTEFCFVRLGEDFEDIECKVRNAINENIFSIVRDVEIDY